MSRRKSKLNFRQVGRTRRENLLLVFSTILYFIGAIFWMELTFHFVMFGSFRASFFFPILFSIPMGAFFGFLCNLTPSKQANYIITCALTFFCCVVFGANIVYYGVFQTYVGVFSALQQGNATQALTFGPFFVRALKSIWDNIFGIILILIPFIFMLTIGRTLLSFRQRKLPVQGMVAGGIVVFHLLCLLIVNFGDRDPYSIYDLYHHNSSLGDEVEQLGLATTMRLDLKSVLFGSSSAGLDNLDLPDDNSDWQGTAQVSGTSGESQSESQPASSGETEPTEPETEPDIHDLYNFLDIDFESLAAQAEEAGNKDLAKIHRYFQGLEPSRTNEYTGIYEGYNLIFLTAEGFSPYAVDEQLTPTLYKLINTGYVFKNFYTPLWYGSTSAGEYVNLVSQFPKDGEYISMKKSGQDKSDMYFCLGRMMERAGYNLWGFHNNSYTYYERNLSHPNMGYENWIAVGSGFEPETTSSGKEYWPQSDLYMIDNTFDIYATSEPFHAYYMTVSGHVEYNFAGNAMSARNKDAVADLPLSDEAKAYIACNMELDKAMASLIQKLEDAGIADRTLVVLTADHIPYDPKYRAMCDEVAAYHNGIQGYTLEDNFELYRNDLIIWTGSMEEGKNVVVEKPCYSLDILPTIANMLGLDYDSRLLMGQDIFSDSEGLVVFPNRSWITDTAMYNGSTKEVISLTGEEVSEDYVSNTRKKVNNKLAISRQLLDVNYYSYLHGGETPE
ncbi:MAG: LTA synthase family protein [Lachnospiraceae bacterium]|nr:LTA synthase family protein [Lachnospiraceae bacterium]